MNKGFSFIFILIAIAGIIFAVVYFFVSQNNPYQLLPTPTNLPNFEPTPTPALKTFKSTNLEFVIEMPARYKAEEEVGRIRIFDIEEKNNIYLARTATDFKSLSKYTEDLDYRNKPNILFENTLIIDDSDAKFIEYDYPESAKNVQREYVIYVEGWIYSIYTDSKNNVHDLDQIAKSFRYTPD